MQNFLFTPNSFNGNRFHTARFCCNPSSETYYDILKVRPDSSNAEIRDAFLKLSKEYHPDVKGTAKSESDRSARFVTISEAYQTLKTSKSRSAYDQDLLFRGQTPTNVTSRDGTVIHRPWEIKPNYDPNPGSYYGIKGLNRVSNFKIVLVLVAVGVIGAIFGFGSVKHTFTLNEKQLDEKSAEASLHHSNVRAEAERFGNEEQLRRLHNRIMRENNR